MLEVDMVNDCLKYLIENKKYINIVREVPFLSRCIDLVLISQNGETITIEFKMKNWRHAIEQAKNHMLGADKSYICLPIKKPSKTLIDMLTKEQIGLYIYCPGENEVMHEYLQAPLNSKKVGVFNSMITETINNIII